jgi:hypothetical protein
VCVLHQTHRARCPTHFTYSVRVEEINIVPTVMTRRAVRSVQSEPGLAARARRVVHDVSGTRHAIDRTPLDTLAAEAKSSACCASPRLGERNEVDQVTVMSTVSLELRIDYSEAWRRRYRARSRVPFSCVFRFSLRRAAFRATNVASSLAT